MLSSIVTLQSTPLGEWTNQIIPLRKPVDIAPLDKTGWLSDQPEAFRSWVADAAHWCRFGAGEFVFLAGDQSDGVYGLASGTVEITFPLYAAEPVAVYFAEVGFWAGESAELAEDPRHVSLMSVTESRMLHLTGSAIRALLSQQPRHWRSFYQLSQRNFGVLLNLLSEALSLSVRARICRRLLGLTERHDEVVLTQEQLAKILGLARSTVRSELTKLTSMDAIELGYGRIRVINRATLERLKNEQ